MPNHTQVLTCTKEYLVTILGVNSQKQMIWELMDRISTFPSFSPKRLIWKCSISEDGLLASGLQWLAWQALILSLEKIDMPHKKNVQLVLTKREWYSLNSKWPIWGYQLSPAHHHPQLSLKVCLFNPPLIKMLWRTLCQCYLTFSMFGHVEKYTMYCWYETFISHVGYTMRVHNNNITWGAATMPCTAW